MIFKLSFPKLGWKCLLIEFSVYIDGKNTKHQYTVDALISLNLHTLIVIQHSLRYHKIYWNLKISENVYSLTKTDLVYLKTRSNLLEAKVF